MKRFIRFLPRARIETRRLTHSLYLPPAPAELYDSPQSNWLADVLDLLPGLKCLIVSQVGFFDHAALVALKTSHPLKLLIASECINVTPTSLIAGLACLPNLVFLDLSHTPAARDDGVLGSLGMLRQMQILKLRRVGLRDCDLGVLVDAIDSVGSSQARSGLGYRLRSLDVRDNFLGDDSVRVIVARLIHSNSNVQGSRRADGGGPLGRELQPHASHSHDQLRGPDLDKNFIGALTHSERGEIYLEDLECLGLTHLYLANNRIFIGALAGLVKTQNLHVLDVGDLDFAQTRSMANLDSAAFDIERLTSSLRDQGWNTLTYLRIDHKLVTASVAQPVQSNKSDQATTGLQAWGSAEVNKEEPISNGPSNLQSDSISELEGQAPAYEAVPSISSRTKQWVDRALDADHSLPAYQPRNISSRPATVSNDQNQLGASSNASQLTDERQLTRDSTLSARQNLSSSHIPAMQTLVLTGVPSLSQSTRLIQKIKDFMSDCAMEHHLATKQAQLEHPHKKATRTTQLFALQTIILEISPHQYGDPASPTSPTSKSKSTSSVNDPDADNLWAAATNDFSFFSDEKPIASRSEPTSSRSLATSNQSLDVVAEIARWRAFKRNEHRLAPPGTFIPGFWPGEVKILRPVSRDGGEESRRYGRYFGMREP